MKKILAIALAIVMMAAITVTSFAAILGDPDVEETRYGDGNDNNTEANYLENAADSQVENTRIEYGVAQAYTVTIPADIHLHEFHGTEGEQSVGYVYGIEALGVSDVVIAGNEKICIYLSSTDNWDDTNGWTLKDANNKSADVNYKIVAKDGDADTTQYLNSSEYDSTNTGIITSGTDSTVATSLILTLNRADGNEGTTGSEKDINLYFSSKGTAQEGTYKDMLTFTVRIEDAQLQGSADLHTAG